MARIEREYRVGARHQQIFGNDDDVTLAVPRPHGNGRSGGRAIGVAGRSGELLNVAGARQQRIGGRSG